jgi:hypothetical protein
LAKGTDFKVLIDYLLVVNFGMKHDLLAKDSVYSAKGWQGWTFY